jgi:hypothetical protein
MDPMWGQWALGTVETPILFLFSKQTFISSQMQPRNTGKIGVSITERKFCIGSLTAMQIPTQISQNNTKQVRFLTNRGGSS